MSAILKVRHLVRRGLAKAGDGHMREILTGAAAALAIRLVGVAATYLFTVIVSRRFGAAGLGVYSLAVTTLAMAALLSGFGFGMSALRFVPQYLAERRLDRFRRVYRMMWALTVPVSIGLAAVLIAGAEPLASRVFNSPDLAPGLRIAGVLLPFLTAQKINIEVIRGFKSIPLSEYLRSLNGPLLAIIVLALWLASGGGASGAMVGYGVGVASGAAGSWWAVRRRLSSTPPAPEAPMSSRELIRLASPMMLGEFMRVYLGRIDTLMVGALAGAAAVGQYDVAFKLSCVTGFFLTAINTIIAPKFSELFWAGRLDELKRVVLQSSRLMFWLSVPVLVLLVAVPRFWLGLFGVEFQAGAVALILLAVGQFVNTAAGSVGCFLTMTGRQDVFRNLTLGAVALNVALNALLVPRWGFTGAAASTMVTLAAWNVTAAAYIWREFRIRTFYLPGLMR
jgi:O-antigen/teichoic acid export membrane protein